MASSSCVMASHLFVLLLLCCLLNSLMIISTNAASIDDVEDGQQQQQQQQQQRPFALFPVASMPAEEFGGDGGGFMGGLPQMAKRRQQLLNALLMTRRLGRSPRAPSASSATMRNALVRFGKRALLPLMALDDKRNPPQPFGDIFALDDQQQQMSSKMWRRSQCFLLFHEPEFFNNCTISRECQR